MKRALLTLAPALLAAGCSRPAAPPTPAQDSTPAQSASAAPATTSKSILPTVKLPQSDSKLAGQRQELSQVPPPAKGRYISITSANVWQNPFVEVGVKTLKVTILLNDANPTPIGQGGITRPAGARRTIQEIRPADLGEMLTDLPAAAWPYGRVVAVEESAQDARRDRVQMRRNMEQTLATLNGLGVVADEWNEEGR